MTTRLDIIRGYATDVIDILDTAQDIDRMALDGLETLLKHMGEQLGAYRWEIENPGLFVLQQECDLHRAALSINNPAEDEAMDLLGGAK